MFDYKYAYLFGSLITLVIWIYLFVKRKDLRKEMIALSLFTLFFAPSNILYYGEYWKPLFVFDFLHIGIESLIVCFTYGGIVGVVYEYLFRKTTYKLKGVNPQINKIELVLSIGIGVLAIAVLELLTPLNIIYTTSTGMIVTGLLFIYFRNDLLVPSLVSGLLTTILSLIVYWILLIFFPNFFDMFWIKDTISNIRWLLIPIEEYYFHFAFGFAVGVMYEVGNGIGIGNRKIRNRRK